MLCKRWKGGPFHDGNLEVDRGILNDSAVVSFSGWGQPRRSLVCVSRLQMCKGVMYIYRNDLRVDDMPG